MNRKDEKDEKYLKIFLEPLKICAEYRPAFGSNKDEGISLSDFQVLYGNDAFYSWIGLDSPLVYAAHRASGGLTSIYRQIGIGSERLLQNIIMDNFSLSKECIEWKYNYVGSNKKTATHILDARISLKDLKEKDYKEKVQNWLNQSKKETSDPNYKKIQLKGAIFEIRQGYKSADSKRQNADLRFLANAYQNGHLPVIAILSSQVSETVIERYKRNGMLVLTGNKSNKATDSTFAFFKDVIGFDLEAFFERVSPKIKEEVHSLVNKLLSTES